MFRLCFIFAIGLFSCRESSVKKVKIVEMTLDSTNSSIDSSSIIKGAFGWRKWEKPTGGRFIYLTDDMLKYVTNGHEAIDASYGDVNEDGMLDLITITAPVNEDSVRSSNGDLSRELLIFLRQNDESFILAVKNSKAIPRFNSCDTIDSYAGHTGLTGRLSINKTCTNTVKTHSEYRFRFESKLNNWLLDTIITASYPSKNDSYILDTITKKDFGNVSLKNFDIQKVNYKK
jgi:hypothetical protein